MRKYYRIVADPNAVNRWYLNEPLDWRGEEVDPRVFTCATWYDGEKPLTVPLQYEGERVDFNFAAFDMIVIPKWLAQATQHLMQSSIQRIEAMVQSTDEEYEILNVLKTVRCVDEEKSEILRWADQNGRPEKVGKYRRITNLTIDPKKVGNHKLFRLDGWEVALIADDTIKEAFERNDVTGASFLPVC